MQRKIVTLALFAFELSLLAACSNRATMTIQQLPEPDYPLAARFGNIQGEVTVDLSIGTDGKVISGKGHGAHALLVQAAEANSRLMIFGPMPQSAEFPIQRSITYVYKLEGKPVTVASRPIVRTFLPNRLEVIATPLVSDYPPIENYRASPPSNK